MRRRSTSVLRSIFLVTLACRPDESSLGGEPPIGSTGSETGSSSTGEADDPDGTSAPPTTTTDPEPGTSGATTSGSGFVPVCGDGEVQLTEECDEGVELNDDAAWCTKDCTINVCGDAKWFEGWELCDQGEANSDMYPSTCTTACEPGAWCGDGYLDAEFGELCDLGPGNGTEVDEQGIPCDVQCRRVARRVFITSAAYTGDLGGVLGADGKCVDAAEAAGLTEPDRFVAYLSTDALSADARYAEGLGDAMAIVTTTGVKIADSYPELLAAGPLDEGIAADEYSEPLYYALVATNTAKDGSVYSPDQHCQAWTSAKPDFDARFGVNAFPIDSLDWKMWKEAGWWLSAQTQPCAIGEYHLYCFER